MPVRGGFRSKCREILVACIDLVDFASQVVQRTASIAGLARGLGCGAIMACSGDLVDLPAAFLAAKCCRLPFYAYMFDDYANQWVSPIARSLAQKLTRLLVQGAAGVIVPNEFLSAAYELRYHITPVIVHNPAEQITPPLGGSWPQDDQEIKILYTGAVYHAHYDAFSRLVDAIQSLGNLIARLYIFSGIPPAILQAKGIRGPVVFHPQVSIQQALELQQTMDILFLPLAFDSSIPEVIKTSAPGKMGEFLASGRPILAHAPADSFVSWYLKRYECGLVVDEADADLLRQAIIRIHADASHRRRLVENALRRARIDFQIESERAKLTQLLTRGKANSHAHSFRGHAGQYPYRALDQSA